jgi:hypothetical protein
MNTPNIDLLLSDITFRRGWLAKMLEVTVHDGDDTRFDAVSIVDLIHEIRALRQQRDEARVVTDAMVERFLSAYAEYESKRQHTFTHRLGIRAALTAALTQDGA